MIMCNQGTEFVFQEKPKCNDLGMFAKFRGSGLDIQACTFGMKMITLTNKKIIPTK